MIAFNLLKCDMNSFGKGVALVVLGLAAALAHADVLVQYNFENVASGALTAPPSLVGSGVVAGNIAQMGGQNLGVSGTPGSQYFNANLTDTSTYRYFSVRFFQPVVLNSLTLDSFTNDGSNWPVAVEWSSDSGFGTVQLLGSFNVATTGGWPPSVLQTVTFTPLSVAAGTYYLRIRQTVAPTTSTSQFQIDNVTLNGTVVAAATVPTLSPSSMGVLGLLLTMGGLMAVRRQSKSS